MKESYGKDPAIHPDPESCVGDRKGTGEALTGALVGQPSSCEIRSSGVPTRISDAAGHRPRGDKARREGRAVRRGSVRGRGGAAVRMTPLAKGHPFSEYHSYHVKSYP
jgi:hypothetical protein